MGITHDGQFKGYLVLGLWVEDLVKNLKNKINIQRHDFLLVDENNREIIGGSRHPRLQKLNYNQKLILIDNVNYDASSKIKDFPFKIYVGVDNEIYFHQIITEVAPRAFEFFSVLSVLFFIVLFLRNNVVKPLRQLSYSAKQISESGTNYKITYYKADEINTVADSIYAMQKSLIDLRKNNEFLEHNYKISQISFLEKEKHYENALKRTKRVLEDIDVCLKVIEKAGISQKEVTNLLDHCKKLLKGSYINFPSSINYTTFDINNLLHECINYFNKEFMENHLKVLKSFTKSMPMYKGDRFQLKQVIIASMSKAINRVFEKGIISIESSYNDEKKEFIITVSDDSVLGSQYDKIISNLTFEPTSLYCISSPIEVLAELINSEEGNIKVSFKDKSIIIYINNSDKIHPKEKSNLVNFSDYQER